MMTNISSYYTKRSKAMHDFFPSDFKIKMVVAFLHANVNKKFFSYLSSLKIIPSSTKILKMDKIVREIY